MVSFSISPKHAVLGMLGGTALGFIFSLSTLATPNWGQLKYGPSAQQSTATYGLWQVCRKEFGDADFQCQATTTEDINSNLNGARAFAIFSFVGAAVALGASVQAWRMAGAHPYPKVVFITSLLLSLFSIISAGAYSTWFAYEVVADEKAIGGNPSFEWQGGETLTVICVFWHLIVAGIVFLGYGFGGALGNGAPAGHTALVEEGPSTASAAASATYHGVAGSV